MNRCENCCVNVYSKQCPLCGKVFDNCLPSETDYPSYNLNANKKLDFLAKLILFLSISTILVTVFINIFTYLNNRSLWSINVIASLLLVIAMLYMLKSKRISKSGKVFYSYCYTSLFMIVIDIANGLNKWSTTFVIPFLTIGLTLIFVIFASSNKNNFNDYFGYLLAIAFISFFPIMIYFLGLSSELWSSLVATLFCLIIAIGLYIFAGNAFKSELRKRFNR